MAVARNEAACSLPSRTIALFRRQFAGAAVFSSESAPKKKKAQKLQEFLDFSAANQSAYAIACCAVSFESIISAGDCFVNLLSKTILLYQSLHFSPENLFRFIQRKVSVGSHSSFHHNQRKQHLVLLQFPEMIQIKFQCPLGIGLQFSSGISFYRRHRIVILCCSKGPAAPSKIGVHRAEFCRL